MRSRPRSFILRLLLCLLGLIASLPQPLLAAARKPALSIGFHVEVRSNASDPFSIQIHLKNPSRIVTLERTPSISERHIAAIHLYPAQDAQTWGCLFKLDDSGRITLSNISSANRGKSLVFFLGNATQNRPILDLLIDSTVEDGFINVPRGITAADAELLRKQFPKSIQPKAAR